jgi:predicted DNA-binding protein (UPF0251 family)/predicted Fe-Mo cluster-binding NifX family protein
VTYFKPRGVPLRELAEVDLPLDGFEAIRLADHEGLSHEEAAQRMQVSRQTFGRILSAARGTVAKALVGGLALRIHGGDYRPGREPTAEQPNADPQPIIETESEPMTKIAITSEGPTLDDLVDPRFGRAAGFVIVDPDTMSFSYVENGAAQARAQGAGIQAAETVARAGVTAVLTGYVGPKAFAALAAAGIRVAQDLENITVAEAVARYISGQVKWSRAEEAQGQR